MPCLALDRHALLLHKPSLLLVTAGTILYAGTLILRKRWSLRRTAGQRLYAGKRSCRRKDSVRETDAQDVRGRFHQPSGCRHARPVLGRVVGRPDWRRFSVSVRGLLLSEVPSRPVGGCGYAIKRVKRPRSYWQEPSPQARSAVADRETLAIRHRLLRQVGLAPQPADGASRRMSLTEDDLRDTPDGLFSSGRRRCCGPGRRTWFAVAAHTLAMSAPWMRLSADVSEGSAPGRVRELARQGR